MRNKGTARTTATLGASSAGARAPWPHLRTMLRFLRIFFLRLSPARHNFWQGSKAGFKYFIARSLLVTVAITALFLLVLLAAASANTAFFDHYYSWLYAANIAVALIFMLIVSGLASMIILRLRQGKFGARLLAKLAVFFALVGALPGSIIYLVSLQFVSRSIESWFDVKIESALESGLELGRGALNDALAKLQSDAQRIAAQISALAALDKANPNLTLLQLRAQFDVQEAMILSSNGALIAQACTNFAALSADDLPTLLMLRAARERGYAAIEGEDGSAKAALRLRVITRIPREERFLQLMHLVPPKLAHDAQNVQHAYRDYQEKMLSRAGLRKMYIGTLTLALFLATFIAMMLAFALGNQLTRPLFLLAQGTREIARGDYTPKGEINTNDELGFLTQSFNAMARQLSEARAAVERNRLELEHSKAYLESVLANLTAGVFVFDHAFRLTTANAGAQRIFQQSFQAYLNQPLEQIAALTEFGAMVRTAFAEHEAALTETHADASHWQQQFELRATGQDEPLTLLVRGARLLDAPDEATHSAAIGGYVVVFDDISDLISAQRRVAWGEVARRLAHEIKNPLTPIQLSAERLQAKLSGKLEAADAEVLTRSATTIVNQVAEMKRMVDEFREYARMPAAVFQDLQLNDLITEVLTLYGAGEGASVFELDLAPLPMIRGDPTQLRQVIHNLLQNAQDAVADVEAAHVLIKTRTVAYQHASASGKRRLAVKLSVSDNGPGFPASMLNRVFEPYITSKAKGMGLGLATVKKIIDEHAARIDVRNCVKANKAHAGGAQVSIVFLQLAASELMEGGQALQDRRCSLEKVT